jgi:molybdate transport system substrate-binding protein
MNHRIIVALALAFTAFGPLVAAQAAPTVYAAASLREAFPAIDDAPKYSFGGSNTLQLQIERGAPADVFASASPAETLALFRAGRCTRPQTFATNILVMIVPNGNPGHVTSAYGLRSGGRRLAIGTPGVPIGAYTRKLLARLHLSSILQSNDVSQETNVSGIVAKVSLGSAHAGFVYYTDAVAAQERTNVIRLPRWAQPPVRYTICAVRRPGAPTSAALEFIARVRSLSGRRLLKHYGFGLPPRG